MKLIYRASRDGFGADEFHSKCDGKRDTLSIIQTTNGYVFGGMFLFISATNGK